MNAFMIEIKYRHKFGQVRMSPFLRESDNMWQAIASVMTELEFSMAWADEVQYIIDVTAYQLSANGTRITC